jgi:competence protein ComEC
MRRHQAFAFGGTSITILAPGPDYVADIKPKNDDSLVLRIDYQATSFLLAGDMEKRTERELISADLLQPATVLKVGHHGSDELMP